MAMKNKLIENELYWQNRNAGQNGGMQQPYGNLQQYGGGQGGGMNQFGGMQQQNGFMPGPMNTTAHNNTGQMWNNMAQNAAPAMQQQPQQQQQRFQGRPRPAKCMFDQDEVIDLRPLSSQHTAMVRDEKCVQFAVGMHLSAEKQRGLKSGRFRLAVIPVGQSVKEADTMVTILEESVTCDTKMARWLPYAAGLKRLAEHHNLELWAPDDCDAMSPRAGVPTVDLSKDDEMDELRAKIAELEHNKKKEREQQDEKFPAQSAANNLNSVREQIKQMEQGMRGAPRGLNAFGGPERGDGRGQFPHAMPTFDQHPRDQHPPSGSTPEGKKPKKMDDT